MNFKSIQALKHHCQALLFSAVDWKCQPEHCALSALPVHDTLELLAG